MEPAGQGPLGQEPRALEAEVFCGRHSGDQEAPGIAEEGGEHGLISVPKGIPLEIKCLLLRVRISP